MSQQDNEFSSWFKTLWLYIQGFFGLGVFWIIWGVIFTDSETIDKNGYFGFWWYTIQITLAIFFIAGVVSTKSEQNDRKKYIASLPGKILRLLKSLNGQKITASDIDARLSIYEVDLVKEICENLYHSGQINRTLNYRYYIYRSCLSF